MTLGELIQFLEARDPERAVPVGFAEPDSYRGYYDELAFAPAKEAPWAPPAAASGSCTRCYSLLSGRTMSGSGRYAMARTHALDQLALPLEDAPPCRSGPILTPRQVGEGRGSGGVNPAERGTTSPRWQATEYAVSA